MCRGSGFRCSLTGGFPRHAFCILIPCTALTLLIQGKSRMRENRSCGFVRGATSDGRPYRDSQIFALTLSVNKTCGLRSQLLVDWSKGNPDVLERTHATVLFPR